MHENASGIYNEYLEIYFNEYKALSDAQTKMLGEKYDPINLLLETYIYDIWSENEESTDATSRKKWQRRIYRFIWHATTRRWLRSKKRKKMKKSPNKLSARLPILLAQIKSINNSYRLKNKIRKLLYLLYQHNKITEIKSL